MVNNGGFCVGVCEKPCFFAGKLGMDRSIRWDALDGLFCGKAECLEDGI